MIHVLLYPETIWEKLNFQIRKIAPSIQCGTIRNGPGVVECIQTEDSCVMVPLDRVMQIIWESGYKAAFEEARKQYLEDAAASMSQMFGASAATAGCELDDDEDDCSSGPYVHSGATVEGYN